MYHYVLLIPAIFAAAIPPQPSIPSSSSCLQKCFSDSSLIAAANDLNQFRAIAIDIEQFCGANAAVLKCGRECPEADIPELEQRTAISSFVCAEKVEEFRLARECLVSSPDVVESCAADCKMPEAPLRLDSSAAALVNPTTEVEKSSENCKRQSCSLQCSLKSFNKACAGTGELYRDMARAQVRLGITRMAAATQKDNETQKKITLDYLNSLPEDCAMLKDLDEFDKVVKMPSESESEKKTESSTKSETQGQVDGEVNKDDNNETTVASELEPSNEPEVPVGPPEVSISTIRFSMAKAVGATPEPLVEVSGQPETDVRLIDHDGRTKQAETPVVEGDATVLSKEKEADDVIEGSGEESTAVSGESNTTTTEGETTTTEESIPAEPVIVIDDDKALENNQLTQGDAAPVKSSAVLGAMLTAIVATLLVL